MTYQYDKQFEKELWQTNKKEWANLQYLKARKFVAEHPELAGIALFIGSSVAKGVVDEVRLKAKIAERKRNGETYDVILKDMGLL